MMEIDSTEFRIRPRVHENSSKKTGSSLQSHLGKLLEYLYMGILKHRSDYFLLKRRQVLRHLSIDLIMLLPKLFFQMMKAIMREIRK
jgi:hypothetical protein